MQIQINPQDGTPIYQQIVVQVKQLIAAGRLKPDDEIPPIRALAETLTINPNTVARAYLELERAGIVYKRHGTGTYISGTTSSLTRREKVRILTKLSDELLTEAYHLGVELNELVEILSERSAAMQKGGVR